MYEHVFEYFGLRENPFCVSPDPRFYVSTPAHDAALAQLVRGVSATQNFTVLTGEAGTGKTILLNHFLNWLGKRRRSTAYVFHPRLKPVELFDCILRDFGIPHQSLDREQLLDTLSHWLIGRQAVGDTPIVVIDEAQAISIRTLDRLRLLLNLSASGKKLLQIVLVGQPELLDKFNQQELRNLRKRVTCQCSLEPFSMEETSQYVKSKLASTGAKNPAIFSRESLETIHGYARGIPRTVNLLCEQTLIAGYAAGAKIISREILRQVAEEFELTPQWADSEEREIPSKFRQLLALSPENPPTAGAPVNSKLETSAPRIAVSEPVAEIQAGGIQIPANLPPTLLIEEPEVQMASTAIPASEPVAATLLTPPSIIPAERNALEDPECAPPMPVPTRSPGTRLREQWVRHGELGRAQLARNAAQIRKRYTQAMSARNRAVRAIKNNCAGLLNKISTEKLKMGRECVRQWKVLQTGVARDLAQVRKRLARAIASSDLVAAAIKDNWTGLLRRIAKATEKRKVGEECVRQWKVLRTGVARGLTQVRKRLALAMASNDLVVAAIKDHWTGLLRSIAKATAKRKRVGSGMKQETGRTIQQILRYRKEVRDSFLRDWKQFVYTYSSPKPKTQRSASSIPHVPTSISNLKENLSQDAQTQSPVLRHRIRSNEPFARQGNALRERFVRRAKQIIDEPTAVPPAHQEQSSLATFPEVRRSPQAGEQFVRYWKEVRDSFVRDWKRLTSSNGSVWVAARKRR